jgi:phospho-N-acetylmuramoyl-pentapeptide-transferase
MQIVLLSVALAVGIAVLGTPYLARALLRRGIGSQERVDGVAAHLVKQGTPTMGGISVVVASTASYALTHVRIDAGGPRIEAPSTEALMVLCGLWFLAGLGGVDDLISATRRRSLGLSPLAKTIAQAVISVLLSILAVQVLHLRPALSWAGQEIGPRLPVVVFVVWVFVLVWIMANGVNVIDGTDGLSSGSSAMALAVYVIIAFWQFRHPATYDIGNAAALLDVAVLVAAMAGACIGFLWWNAPPAQIILGDTGAMALGGALVAIAIVTKTQLLLLVIGGLFIADYASSLLQIFVFKLTRRLWPHPDGTGRRIFAMAPVHHHFEVRGWPEITVTIRFWLIAALFAGAGLALFYLAYLGAAGLR